MSGGAQPPAIASYAGRAPLASWVRVVATRIAIDLARQRRGDQDGDDLLEQVAAQTVDPERAALKLQHVPDVNAALAAAVRALPERDRELLRLHFRERQTLEVIAQRFGVTKSTVSRWIDRVGEGLLDAVRAHLMEVCRLGGTEADSLIGTVRSELHLSMSGLFGP